MKTEFNIKTDIYHALKTSNLIKEVNGRLTKDGREDDSLSEDVSISILSEVSSSQVQEVYVNINVYVQDLKRDTRYVENSIRLSQLCDLAIETLSSYKGKDFRISLESHKVFAVQGRNEHAINFKVLYQYCNENYKKNRLWN